MVEHAGPDIDDAPEQAAFRARVQAWLAANRADAPATSGSSHDTDYVKSRLAWQRKLAEGGLAGATWPTQYGGQGLGPMEQVIIGQEIARAGVPGALDVGGINTLAPAVIAHGTEEQKVRHLAPLLRGDEVWCQLFSEPSAGSDLAAVRSRARLQDDGSWLLTGQKVWTTYAHIASFGLMLARTDPGVPKHQGLTMFIVPMDAQGVTVRPLRLISGEAEFNEVFFDDVIIPSDSVVGTVGEGWRVALTTLMYERLTFGVSSQELGITPERFASAIAGDDVARNDTDVRRRLGDICTEMLSIRFSTYRTLTALSKGQAPGPETGLAKITLINAAIAAGDLVVDILGPDALAPESEFSYIINIAPGLKSAGGPEPVLRNMIGERVLGLPPEPRVDKDVPFSALHAN